MGERRMAGIGEAVRQANVADRLGSPGISADDEAILAMDELGASKMEVKVCPVCESQVFADMSRCYNCMYEFGCDPDEPDLVIEPWRTKGIEPCRGKESEPDSAEDGLGKPQAAFETDELLGKFLVEFHGFLGQFLLDSKVHIQ